MATVVLHDATQMGDHPYGEATTPADLDQIGVRFERVVVGIERVRGLARRARKPERPRRREAQAGGRCACEPMTAVNPISGPCHGTPPPGRYFLRGSGSREPSTETHDHSVDFPAHPTPKLESSVSSDATPTRRFPPETLACLPAKAGCNVVVHHSHCLHERVADGRTDETESSAPERPAHRLGYRCRGRDVFDPAPGA